MPMPATEKIDAIAVVGLCETERSSRARDLARDCGFVYISPRQTSGGVDAVDRMIELVRSAFGAQGVVLEYAPWVPIVEIVGALSADDAATRLRDVVCVVDAHTLLSDLESDAQAGFDVAGQRHGHGDSPHGSPLHSDSPHGSPLYGDSPHGSSSLGASSLGDSGHCGAHDPPVVPATCEALASQIEFASTIIVGNSLQLCCRAREVILALVSHLAPEAYVVCHDSTSGDQARPPQGRLRSSGWVSVLNGEFSPRFTAPGLAACRYEQFRPFHPGRLLSVLTRCLGHREFGHVVRSAGFAHVASRPQITAQWDHVGPSFTLTPIALDDTFTSDDELLAIGQDIAFIGFDIDEAALRLALDEAVLTDAELTAGPVAWAQFDDRLPTWPGVGGR